MESKVTDVLQCYYGGCVMVYVTKSTGTNTGEMEGHCTLRQPNQCGTECVG